MFVDTGSAVVDPAVTVAVTLPLTGATYATLHTMFAPLDSGAVVGLAGVQLTVAPAGSPGIVQRAAIASLGPLFTHVIVPVTACPALTDVGKVLPITAMSACGVTISGLLSTLLARLLSAVAAEAVVAIFSGPLAGAVNADVQTIALPAASGSGTAPLGSSVHDCVAPLGKPLKAQPAATAALMPALRQRPLTVTDCPDSTGPIGTVVTACMSAIGETVVFCCARLFEGTGSIVLAEAFAVTTTSPEAGTIKLTVHVMAAPTGKGLGVGDGTQLTTAPNGEVSTAHCGLVAALGPAFRHVTVAATEVPAGAEAGRPLTEACISAFGIAFAM